MKPPERRSKVRASLPLLFCLGLLALPARLYAWDGAFFDLLHVSYSARASAVGGPHAALADDLTVLFTNPAGYLTPDPRFSVSQMTLSVYNTAFPVIANTLKANWGGAPTVPAILDLVGPIAIGYVGNGWGLGLYSTSNLRLYTGTTSLPFPSGWEVIEQTFLGVVGRSVRVPLPESWSSTLDLGVSLNLFAAGRTLTNLDIRPALFGLVDPVTFLADAAFFQRAIGASVELGILYSFRNILSIGITGQNLSLEQIRVFGNFWDFVNGAASAPTYNILPLDVSAGLVVRPPLGPLYPYITELTLLADYHNIFDFLIYPPGATNPLLHIGLGAEMRLLKILSLRAGFYQWLPSFGFGLHLSLFDLNVAYAGRELSAQPGGSPVYSLSVGLDFTY